MVVLLIVATVGGGGCVRRRMTIRSNPPGAMVYVDDYPIGLTPVSTNFTYYGTRKIRLVKDGYQTLTVMQPVTAPWYQYTPIDFVAENMVPGEIRDQRTFTYTLAPQTVVPTGTLLDRAEQLRQGMDPALATGSSPPPFSPPVIQTPGGPPPPPSAPMTPIPPAGPSAGSPEIGGQPVYPLSPGGR